ncbi:MAG: hypothetical protein KBC91_07075, partial [Candidatus Omnitrophica bacterium]|nr:hypothetical protein [Candidatus Omnitrophota bacterium]
VGTPLEKRGLDFEAKLGKKANSSVYRQLSMAIDIAKAGDFNLTDAVTRFLDKASPVFVNFQMAFDGRSLTAKKALRIARKLQSLPASDYRSSLLTMLAGFIADRRTNYLGENVINDKQYLGAKALMATVASPSQDAASALLDAIKLAVFVRRALAELEPAIQDSKQLVTATGAILTEANQLDPFQEADENRPGGPNAYFPINNSQTTALPTSLQEVQQRVGDLGAPLPDSTDVQAVDDPSLEEPATRMSAVYLEDLYHQKLFRHTYGNINGAGKGTRFAEQDHKQSPAGPHAKDKAKGTYLQYFGSVLGWRSYYEFSILQMEASNKKDRGYLSSSTKADNKPLVINVSHFTEEDTIQDIARLGFESYRVGDLRELAQKDLAAAQAILSRFNLAPYFLDALDENGTKVANNVTVFHHPSREFSPVIFLVPVGEEALIDEQTGELADFTMPHLRLHPEDRIWPDNHDGAFFSPILSGVVAYLNKTGRYLRLIGNIDNRAADMDPKLFSMLYLSGKSLMNILARIIKEKGGTATNYKSFDELPDWITVLAERLGREFPAGSFQNLTEGIESAPASAAEEEGIAKLVARFNTGTHGANDKLFIQELFKSPRFAEAYQNAVRSNDAAEKALVLALAFRMINYRFEQHKTVLGTVTTTSLAGGVIAMLASALFVQAPRGAKPEPSEVEKPYHLRSSMFEPGKENIMNNLSMLAFALWVKTQLNSEDQQKKLKDINLDDVMSAMGRNDNKLRPDELQEPAAQLLAMPLFHSEMAGMTSQSELVAQLTGDYISSQFIPLHKMNKTIDEAIKELAGVVKSTSESLHLTGKKLEKDLEGIDLNFNSSPAAKSEVRTNTRPTQDLLAETAASVVPTTETSPAASQVADFVGGVQPNEEAARSEVRLSLTATSRISALAPEEEDVLGKDFISTFFTSDSTLYRQADQYLVRENLDQLPEIDAGMKLWVRYLATHPDVTWALDVDNASQSDVAAFETALIESAKVWGTPIRENQIQTTLSKTVGLDAWLLSRLMKKDQAFGYLSNKEGVLEGTQSITQASFRRIHDGKALDRMIAAEALRLKDQITDELKSIIGPLSQLATAVLKVSYAELTTRFEAYQRIAASA